MHEVGVVGPQGSALRTPVGQCVNAIARNALSSASLSKNASRSLRIPSQPRVAALPG